MKLQTLAFATITFLTACKKDEPTVNYVPAATEIKYKITLSHDTITEYSVYHNNQLISTQQYFFYGSTIEIITKNSSGTLTGKSVYQIGNSGYAETSIDSSFSDSGTFSSISVSTMEYQNGYLTKKTVDTGKYVFTYSISGDNITSFNVAFPNWQSGCTDLYTYGAKSTPIDVINFKNKIFGKSSKNLTAHASLSNGCPCGPSSNPASSDFEYEFDSNGYLTKMKNYYTPCHHTGTGSLTGTITTTTYEY